MTETKFNSKQFYTLVGKNIEKHRKLHNESLQTLAEKLGVTKKTVHRYERGEIKVDIERLIQIAVVLQTSVAVLTNGILTYSEGA